MFNNIYKKYQDYFKSNHHIKYKTIFGYEKSQKIHLIYNQIMVDEQILQNNIISKLNISLNNKDYNFEDSNLINLHSIMKDDYEDMERQIFSGSILIITPKNEIFSIDAAKNIIKNNETAQLLSDDIDISLALLYKYIKNISLIDHSFSIGGDYKTKISMLYLNGIAEPALIEKVIDKIEQIEPEGIISVDQLSNLLNEKENLFFSLNQPTLQIDSCLESLNAGKVIILCDGFKTGLIMPVTLASFCMSGSREHENFVTKLLDKVLSLTAILFALFLLGFYTCLICFHPQFFPPSAAMTIFNSYQNVLMSPQIELFVIFLIFNLLRIAGQKSSKLINILLFISAILFALIAADSGLISQFTILIVGISSLYTFIISDQQKFNNAILFLQTLIFVASLLFGIIGFIGFSIIIIIYLTSLESFELPFLHPFAPFSFKDFCSIFLLRKHKTKKGEKQ